MFTRYRTQGFILKKFDIGEADRIFTIYTKNFGKLDFLAKAERKIKSKLRGGLELFYLSEVEFIQGKAYKTLTDAILINSFQNLRKDLKKLNIAFKISEVLDDLIKREELDKKVWHLLQETIEHLNNLNLKLEAQNLIYYYFFWNFFSILGYQPELYNCALCQKKLTPENIYFSPKEGGLICNQCKASIKTEKKVNAETIKLIRILLKRDSAVLGRLKIEDKDLKDLKIVSQYYLAGDIGTNQII